MAAPFHLPDVVTYAVPGFVLLVLAEMIVAWARDKTRYEPKDTLTSLALGTGSTVAGVLTVGAVYALATWLYQFRLFTIGWQWYWFVICFVIDDFAYYLFHRSAHRVRWFWASHVIHHSSQHYNLSTALRQTWTGFVSIAFIFRLPLFLIGFPPAMVIFVGGVNLIYQFWIHTEVIGRMPRWFEAVMNTPSHHRVHHATNPRYLDRNYAGVFIVWDKWLGTFEPERDDEAPRYGIVKNLGSFNVLWAAFHEWAGIAKDVWRAPGLKAKWGYVAKPPGWSHDGSRETSESIKTLWEQREREKSEWSKRTSSSSAGDRAAPPRPAGSARTAATR
ncbi:sterol desaturase family protein [Sphingomonas sp.]|jgi:sterol desaturase/sphingolipid hydroxylase (fatty acid hydroxylase superfamily)|uniref:sterol desaturase family protein n=1 Tax=Sphingomonas sp. TaxID=28214 RepID=UPI002E310165|nr:sterol desaturase family protein [Sphingomonas sp.]HEX4695122.1 sterol desaturase family protein [Sphingomonas sp.]